MWAEQFGIGEIGLAPAAFWSLTVREFWIKHAAFSRAEDRAKALMLEHALSTANYKPSDKRRLGQTVNALRRYPIKSWLR